MTKPADPPPQNEDDVKGKFKGWFNEVLDEREKAAADKAEAERKEKEKTTPPTFDPIKPLRDFLGF